MTFTTSDQGVQQAVQAFGGFDVDTQLAMLWFGYLDLKEQLNPGNATSSQTTAEAVYHQIEALSQEEQLQAMRDIAGRKSSNISQMYGALDPSAKLDVWLRLSQGMEDGRIIPMPPDYDLPSETQDLVNQLKQFEFDQRINFARDAVLQMGTQPQQGAPV
jgi:hypothetical protein